MIVYLLRQIGSCPLRRGMPWLRVFRDGGVLISCCGQPTSDYAQKEVAPQSPLISDRLLSGHHFER